ncbi:single-stranded DNA-binding protein [Lacrimispora xylanolytica]|uniref:Single-stranded DNA-binding protein n=1 Tax=Lacrimispora xylanolytica TaxID=29375 RepID=A0ABY7AJN9_9FIRM|nr:single-stranded DNA-binding protein [Lacrimispora xylanolytica]WAJ26084.1 single-stranded DNA-binding protein [Lacrimispora xylanolytica]
MNKVILIGRLTRDPEVRYSDGGHTVARFSVAVDREFKKENEQTADFIGCVAFGKTAEFVEKYFFQGNKIVIEGRIQTGSYTNQDGQKVYTTDVVAENVEFGESKNSNNTAGAPSEARPAPSSAIGDGFMKIPDSVEDEGLPFN